MKQTMKQQLKNLLPRKEVYKGLPPTPIGKDGVTHINVGRQPTTELGKKLNFISHTPFVINIWLDTLVSGRFNSIDALWKFIKSPSRDDRLRESSVNKIVINKAEKQLKKNVYIPNFKQAIVYATHQKILQNPEIIELIKQANEEFKSRNQEFLLDMYTTKVVDSVMWRERPPEAMWFIRAINLVVQNILNGKFDDNYHYDWLVDDFEALRKSVSYLQSYLNDIMIDLHLHPNEPNRPSKKVVFLNTKTPKPNKPRTVMVKNKVTGQSTPIDKNYLDSKIEETKQSIVSIDVPAGQPHASAALIATSMELLNKTDEDEKDDVV